LLRASSAVRLRDALSAPLAGGKSLAEVALDAGFGSQAHFCRAFRKATGLSPRAYRELHRGRAVTVVPVPNGNIGQERGKF
jgi:AraC-like DNA-binding protein